jgi:hypothetical protein
MLRAPWSRGSGESPISPALWERTSGRPGRSMATLVALL